MQFSVMSVGQQCWLGYGVLSIQNSIILHMFLNFVKATLRNLLLLHIKSISTFFVRQKCYVKEVLLFQKSD